MFVRVVPLESRHQKVDQRFFYVLSRFVTFKETIDSFCKKKIGLKQLIMKLEKISKDFKF